MLEKSVSRGFRTFTIPEKLSHDIWKALGLEMKPAHFKMLANDILRMSDFYIQNPGASTPWSEEWCQRAQLGYFLPLNYVRNRAVFQEGQRFGFFEGIKTATDIGSGLGAVRLAAGPLPIRWKALEISETAQNLSRHLSPDLQFLKSISKTDLVTFSYSLTEEIPLSQVLSQTENLLLLEPALRDDSRKIQRIRQDLLDQGWNIWAPCTHQESCPLLKNELDWCHDRVHFQAPDWFLEIESHLPMKNLNLAHSYLLASKRPAQRISNSARIVGDFLEEKGKSKLVICHSSEKENLTWLHRHLEPEEISRGALVEIPQEREKKSLESRVSKDLKIIHL